MLTTSMEMWTEAAGKAQERCAATLTHLTLEDDSTTYSTHISIQRTLTHKFFPTFKTKLRIANFCKSRQVIPGKGAKSQLCFVA